MVLLRSFPLPLLFMFPPRRRFAQRAFTLLEFMTVILVVTILLVLIFPVIEQFQRRLEKTRCIGNLRSLHVATNTYVQDHHTWPQIAVVNGGEPSALATVWIETLKPYGLNAVNWICPTTQKKLNSPDYTDPNDIRIDYTAFPYGHSPQDPFRYANQPWFIENGDVHGNGQLLIFPDGHTEELVDFYKRMHSTATH